MKYLITFILTTLSVFGSAELRNLVPAADNAQSLGTADKAWSNVYIETYNVPASVDPTDLIQLQELQAFTFPIKAAVWENVQDGQTLSFDSGWTVIGISVENTGSGVAGNFSLIPKTLDDEYYTEVAASGKIYYAEDKSKKTIYYYYEHSSVYAVYVEPQAVFPNSVADFIGFLPTNTPIIGSDFVARYVSGGIFTIDIGSPDGTVSELERPVAYVGAPNLKVTVNYLDLE